MAILTAQRAREIWLDVVANRDALEACPGHRFTGGPTTLGERHACLRCNGVMGNSDIYWYIAGAVSAGGDPNAIWPGWRGK